MNVNEVVLLQVVLANCKKAKWLQSREFCGKETRK